MGKTSAEMVSCAIQKDLSLIFKPPERTAVKHSVAVPLEIGSERMKFFKMTTPVRLAVMNGISSELSILAGMLVFKFPDH
jgi:hypothetical protein